LIEIAAHVLASHAMHDAFAVIPLGGGGNVAAVGEHPVVGTGCGQDRGICGSKATSARLVWAGLRDDGRRARRYPALVVMACTTDVTAMAIAEPLYGFSFALLHLACMRLIGRLVPADLAATAQAIYGTAALGATTAIVTVLSLTCGPVISARWPPLPSSSPMALRWSLLAGQRDATAHPRRPPGGARCGTPEAT
jgi:PPP family 3-phenylpropionic acid transporter